MADALRIWTLSDLHQEVGKLAWSPSETPEHDVVVLAGDVAGSPAAAVEYAAEHFTSPVIVVAGNHEFYGHGVPEAIEAGRHAASRTANVRFLEDDAITLMGTRFVGATLWTDFCLFGEETMRSTMAQARQGTKDFDQILAEEPRYPFMPTRFTPRHARDRHLRSRAFLREALAKPFDGPRVVVTHHAPTWKSVAPKWAEERTTAAFASDLSDLLAATTPDLWIHGHTHTGFDYQEGRTRVVCNPRGYEGERPDFDPTLVVAADGSLSPRPSEALLP